MKVYLLVWENNVSSARMGEKSVSQAWSNASRHGVVIFDAHFGFPVPAIIPDMALAHYSF